ncbi:MAG: RsmD family RNA methyltransferase, partial [Spirochaetia bacterium]
MRVTGGEYGGRRIDVPPGEIRPAMDRMRESVFSILGSALGSLQGTTVLDLFSGSGSMALEALSRGARSAVLVERDRGKAKVVRQNLSYVEPERWKLVIAPVERYLKRARPAAAEGAAPEGGAGAADSGAEGTAAEGGGGAPRDAAATRGAPGTAGGPEGAAGPP